MNRKRNCKRWLAVFAMLSALMLGSIIASAASGDIVTVKVTGTYGQTEARSMLDMINDFRAEPNVQCWVKDEDTDEIYETYYNSSSGGNMLSPLKYDYDLEEIAMKRAMQIALQYEHTRPDAPINPDPEHLPNNPDDCVYPLISGSYSTAGENIAAGYATAEDVFVGWQEKDKDYWGQGHRRNMLNPKFTCVGIGHVYYNGTNYWVQVFRAPTGSTEETVAIDVNKTVDMEILESNIEDKEITASEASLEIPYGDSVSLPGISCKLLLNETWPKKLCPVTLDSSSAVWTVESGSSCVSIDSDNGRITGTKCGEAQISTTIWGQEVAVDVNVTPKPIDDAEITLDPTADLSYTGSEITPEVSEVLLSDTLLEEGVDYSVSYSENTEVGMATVTITGIGNYVGTATATFEISRAELMDANSKAYIENQTYTGSEIEPEMTVTRNGIQLSSEDYEVSYEYNINAGTALVYVFGIGNYSGEILATFEIDPADISECICDEIPDQDYTGEQIKPEVSLSWNGRQLKSGTDYEVIYGANIEVGSLASVDVSGIGNFTGDRQITFEIVPADLSNAKIEEIDPQVYTGEEIIVDPAVVLNETVLVQGRDYTLSYSDNVNAGQCIVTVEGKGNYTGTLDAKFTIEPMPLTDEEFTIDPIPDQTYTGEAIEPAVTVYANSTGEELEPGTDYTVSYEDNSDAGTATVSITGKNNYTDTLSSSFEITPVEFDETFELSIPEQTFTGEEIEAPVTVVWGKTTLEETTDYQVLYYDSNRDAGTASVTIAGIGNFSGELTGNFEILPADLSDCTASMMEDSVVYDGSPQEPDLSVELGDYTLIEGRDYEAKYSDNTEVGTATVTLSAPENGTGNFTGTKTVTFDILPIDLVENNAIVRPIKDQTYTGSSIKPEVIVELYGQTLKADVDYTVSYKNNQDAGKASVTVTGTGNYTGTLSADFTILPVALSDEFKVTIPEQTYTGAPVEPSISIQWGDTKLAETKDFSVTYTGNHTDAGTVTVKITGKGNYSGKIEENFDILKADLDTCSVNAIPDQTYTGSAIRPELTVLLKDYELIKDVDYTVSYTNNTAISTARSTAKVTLSGIGNFEGRTTQTFKIVPIDLVKNGAVIQPILPQTYTGEALTPPVTVKYNNKTLTEETDYEVSYANNLNAGTATITVTGLGNYTGELTADFQILPMELTEDDCTLGEIPEQTYTGAAITPSVTVMLDETVLTAGADYTVDYSNNKNAGEATAIVTATGNYSGELGSVTFVIVPASLADCKVDKIADQTYTGSAITPAVTVRLGENVLVQGEDYNVSYANNVAIGTATVTLTGVKNCTGTSTLSFTIIAPAVPQPTPGTPETPGSGTSTSVPNIPVTALLQQGAVEKDPATGASYRITQSSTFEVTVEYMAPANKNQAVVTVPDTVAIKHVACKVTSVAANAFKNDKKLKKVVIGKNVVSIGKNAFRGCSKLATVKFNNRINKINAAAFYGCTALKSITIPATVKSIGKQAFYKCSSLKNITIKSKKLTAKSVGKMAFSKISRKAVVKVPASKKKAYRTLLKKKGLPASAKIK